MRYGVARRGKCCGGRGSRVARLVEKDETEPAEAEHEASRQPLDDELPVDAVLEDGHRHQLARPGGGGRVGVRGCEGGKAVVAPRTTVPPPAHARGIFLRADGRRFLDHIEDEPGANHKVQDEEPDQDLVGARQACRVRSTSGDVRLAAVQGGRGRLQKRGPTHQS